MQKLTEKVFNSQYLSVIRVIKCELDLVKLGPEEVSSVLEITFNRLQVLLRRLSSRKFYLGVSNS